LHCCGGAIVPGIVAHPANAKNGTNPRARAFGAMLFSLGF
jgi:hypothetical protein